MELESLPIAKDISDCKRNFDDVLRNMDSRDKDENSRLIDIFNILLDSVIPSEMGDKIADQIFVVRWMRSLYLCEAKEKTYCPNNHR